MIIIIIRLVVDTLASLFSAPCLEPQREIAASWTFFDEEYHSATASISVIWPGRVSLTLGQAEIAN